MKNKIIGTVFFITVFAFSIPGQSEKKFIQLNSQYEIETFISDSASQNKSIETVFIKAQADSITWENLFVKLQEYRRLKSISLEECNISFVPKTAKNLRNLDGFTLNKCEETDAEEWIEALVSCNLHNLKISVDEFNEIPSNINWLGQLDTMSIVKKNTPSPDESFAISFERAGTNPFIFCSNGNKKELSKADMDFLGNAVKNMDEAFYEKIRSGITLSPAQAADEENEKEITQKFSIEPGAKTSFVYERSGTVISIPENAFVDTKGKKIKGTVNIQYKEFRGTTDLLFSGIPLHVNNKDEQGDMESAGMFQLNATDERGNSVFLAKDKGIDVNFIGTDTLSKDYNFYSFNSTDSSWIKLGKIAGGAEKDIGTTGVSKDFYRYKIPSTATTIYRSLLYSNRRIYDTTCFDARFFSNKHDYTLNKKAYLEQRKQMRRSDWRRLNKERIVKLGGFKQTRYGEVLVKLNFSSAYHPELAAFSNSYFKLTGFKKSRDLRNAIGRNRFSDVRLAESGGEIQMTLKNKGTQTVLNLEFYKLKGDTFVEFKDGGAKMMARYIKKLNKRRKIFDKLLEKKKQKLNMYSPFSDEKTKKEYAYDGAIKFMRPEEKAMDKNTWMRKGFEVEADASKSTAASGAVAQSFRIRGFGIFNCDKMYQYREKTDIVVKLKQNDGRDFNAQAFYVVLNSNTVVNYAIAGNTQIITVPTNGKIGIVAVDKDGNIGVCKYDLWKSKKVLGSKEIEFSLEGFKEELKSADQVTAMLGL